MFSMLVSRVSMLTIPHIFANFDPIWHQRNSRSVDHQKSLGFIFWRHKYLYNISWLSSTYYMQTLAERKVHITNVRISLVYIFSI